MSPVSPVFHTVVTGSSDLNMDQCDSLITKLITMLLDWYSGDIYYRKDCYQSKDLTANALSLILERLHDSQLFSILNF